MACYSPLAELDAGPDHLRIERNRGLGCLGFQGFRFRVGGLRIRFRALGFDVWGLGIRVWDLGLEDSGSKAWDVHNPSTKT